MDGDEELLRESKSYLAEKNLTVSRALERALPEMNVPASSRRSPRTLMREGSATSRTTRSRERPEGEGYRERYQRSQRKKGECAP